MVKKYHMFSYTLLVLQVIAAVVFIAALLWPRAAVPSAEARLGASGVASLKTKSLDMTGVFFPAVAFGLFTAVLSFSNLLLFLKMDRAKKYDELEKMALTDGLTGLYNRRYFDRFYENAFSQSSRYNMPLSLIMCDIDHFKKINDAFGHDEGDAILKILSDAMKKNVREADVVARYGGEEFIVCLPQTSIADAFEAARKLYYLILTLETGYASRITVSMGVAGYKKGTESKPKDLLKRVDNLLYQAKNNGRNRIVSEDSYGEVIEIDENSWTGEPAFMP